jgi:hypothetical protein
MCCQKPGCEKTFLKYYVDKRGSTDWSQPRKYCCIEHSCTHFQQENPTGRCQKPGCTNTFLKYYVDKRRGRIYCNQPRKYCHELVKPLFTLMRRRLPVPKDSQYGAKMRVKWISSIEFVSDYKNIGMGQGGHREDHMCSLKSRK